MSHATPSRYATDGHARAFSIPDADFQRGDTTLKRRRKLPALPSAPPSSRAVAPSQTRSIAAIRARSKSRSRFMPQMGPGQHFVALGSNRAGGAVTQNTNKTSYYHPRVPETPYRPFQPLAVAAAGARPFGGSRWNDGPQSTACPRRNPSPALPHSTRAESEVQGKQDKAAAGAMQRTQRERSKSAARRSGGGPMSFHKDLEMSRSGTKKVTESKRTRSKSKTRTRSKSKAQTRSKSKARTRSKSKARTRSKSKTRERSRSKTRERETERARKRKRFLSCSQLLGRSEAGDTKKHDEKSTRTSSQGEARSSRCGSSLDEIEDAIANAEQELKPKKKELDDLRGQMEKFRKRVEAKELEVYDMQVDLDALRKRRDRRLPSHQSESSREDKPAKRPKSTQRESRHSVSRPRPSKRPCIVDEEDDEECTDDDDDVVIIEPHEMKQELGNSAAAATGSTVVPVEDSMPDHFWGRSPTPKLLANHRFRAIPDGSARKGRHLAFNPIQPQIFATSPDEGGLILWSYQRQDQDIAKVVTLTPSSFRRSSPCAEAVSWSPDGNRMAMAFRDPVDDKGELCIVQLHQLKLEDSCTPQSLPRDRITSKRTILHPRGISTIGWLPSGFGSETSSRQVITTGNSDHAVVLWEEHEDRQSGALDLKWSVLHRDHRSEVKSLCIHSKRDCLYTGGFDGLLIRYDVNKGCTETVMERRKPNICKINSILEHPHNPNLLLVSSVEQAQHNMLLYDVRQRYDSREMSLTWEGSSTSQYIVPRWSPAGYHVSCGSKTGVVNIWDVRMRGDKYPTVEPQQALRVHSKTVLHATWHPRYDAMFTVSHDRTLGLLTFR
ncbi:unnamed protein product [Hyaloperonospora brassicae]|uniref:Anaphase-promoting complex subunit 4 WD40 domain-containing protein n=1 Tax=Hyaloperonospora brassicae TaxID=162125 RepID=A0AAV0T292_HYABA|nr:unnamed protein product [Hyaloperonospora brassicae]